MKKCRKCERLLPISEFNKHSRTLDGLQSYCRECFKQIGRERHSRTYDSVANRANKYGLTRNEVEAYLQIPACQICNTPFDSDSDVNFDHCHQRGHVRGVLCHTCNKSLAGTAAQCIVRSERSIDYLLRDMEVRHEQARAG